MVFKQHSLVSIGAGVYLGVNTNLTSPLIPLVYINSLTASAIRFLSVAVIVKPATADLLKMKAFLGLLEIG
jgi:hypothetical protein